MSRFNILATLTATIFMVSCQSVEQVGKLNMISNRNVDTNFNYERISTYSGGSKKEFRKSNAETIEHAVDQTVKKVIGGEFLMNAKIYMVNNEYFAVEGDVWGKSQNISHRGIGVGDNVIWKNKSLSAKLGSETDYQAGTVKALKDEKTCLIELDDTKELIELTYDEITKVE